MGVREKAFHYNNLAEPLEGGRRNDGQHGQATVAGCGAGAWSTPQDATAAAAPLAFFPGIRRTLAPTGPRPDVYCRSLCFRSHFSTVTFRSLDRNSRSEWAAFQESVQ
jgi:hypothetical protein